jgi:dGTPase
MTRMNWTELLSAKRMRKLLGGADSAKSAKEMRTEYERDYGRTIYSAPFRRLKQKAQVFPLEPGDYVRTRLTHSQEVSSVAEDIASQLTRTIQDLKKLKPEFRDAVPLVAATCGLIHDLGNPPFGHAGELAISTWFEEKMKSDQCFLHELSEQQRQDFLKFEGNAHTLRIISNLCLLTDDYGLNYTCGTFSAARKYLPPSNGLGSGHLMSKPGYFWSERDIVKIAATKTGTHDRRHPLAFLVEAADDIVYSVVDLEDGIKHKVLDWHDLKRGLEKECSGNSLLKGALRQVDKAMSKTGLAGAAEAETASQLFRISVISEFAIAAKEVFQKRYESIMEGGYDGELLLDDKCRAQPLVRACKSYARKHLYASPNILKLEIRGRRVIHELMDLLWEAVEDLTPAKLPPKTNRYPGKIYHLISDNYRRVFEKRLRAEKEHPKYCKLQLVADYVAGMTDTFACQLHRDLTNE